MPLLRDDARLAVRARLNLTQDDDNNDVLDAEGVSVLSLSSQIDNALDEAAKVTCRHLVLLPGKGQILTTVGQGVYSVGEFDAVPASSGTEIPDGGDGSRLWTVVRSSADVRFDTRALARCERKYLAMYYADLETTPNGTPLYWCLDDDTAAVVRIHPKPDFILPLRTNGYLLPPSITQGWMQFDFLDNLDGDYSGIVDYAAFKVAVRQIDAPAMKERLETLAADWTRWAVRRYEQIPPQTRAVYGMVLPEAGAG